MAPGGTDADEPIYRHPLPPEDRIWRHPSEIAGASRRRRRRRRSALTGAGTVVAGVIIWTSAGQEPQSPSDPESTATALISLDSTSPLTLGWADRAGAEVEAATGTVQSASGAETLAQALAIRDGDFLITSGAALAGHTELLVVTVDRVERAEVVGHDQHTDISVLRVGDRIATPGVDDRPDPLAGDRIALVDAHGPERARIVARPLSMSAGSDGRSLIGVVELEGPLGDALPGSPAVDEEGDIIGIVGATAQDAPAAVIPIGVARAVADQIIDHGAAVHPLMGVTVREIGAGDPPRRGALVSAVVPDGPADAGGVQVGDVITSIGEIRVATLAEMVATLREHEPGETVVLTVIRDGAHVGCSIVLASTLEPAA